MWKFSHFRNLKKKKQIYDRFLYHTKLYRLIFRLLGVSKCPLSVKAGFILRLSLFAIEHFYRYVK